MTTWGGGPAATPRTVGDWMNNMQRQMDEMNGRPRGLGRSYWKDDVKYDDGLFRVVGPCLPGYRKLDDGRIELRGQLERGTMVEGGWTPGPLNDGDVILTLNYECAPPYNEKRRSSVTSLAPCTVANNNFGVFRIDIQLEEGWKFEDKLDADGKPVLDNDGNPVKVFASRTEVIARTPRRSPMVGWVAFDGVIYDPHTYLNAIGPVPIGEAPMIDDPGYSMIQNPNGSVEWFLPGVDYSGNYIPDSGRVDISKDPLVVWIPHQDDETLSMAASIVNGKSDGRQVYVNVLTDGSASGGQPGSGLTVEQFVEARNREMMAAIRCLAPNAFIDVGDTVTDGTLDADTVQGRVVAWAAAHGPAAHIGTSLNDAHPDHQAIGLGLLRSGVPYTAFRSPIQGSPPPVGEQVGTTAVGRAAVRAAVAEYSVYDPSRGRYAIGHTSVPAAFDWKRDNPVDWESPPGSEVDPDVLIVGPTGPERRSQE